MTIARFVVLSVVLAAAPARASGPEALETIKLPLAGRVAGQQALAEAARARGDRDREAAHEIEACFGYLLMTFDPTGAPCIRAETAARALPHTFLLARLRGYQSNIVAWSLDWDRARAIANEAERLARGGPAADTFDGDALRTIHLTRGGVEQEAGRYGAVESELSTLLSQATTAGDLVGVSNAKLFLCRFYGRTGQLAEAVPVCADGLAVARKLEDPLLIATLLWQRGSIEAIREELAAAVATWDEALAAVTRAGAPYLEHAIRLDLAATLTELGRVDEAATHAKVSRVAAKAAPASFGFQQDWLEGGIAARRGDHATAIERYRAAQASPIDSIVTSSLIGEADAHQARNELPAAEAGYRAAISRIETARAGVAKLEQRAGIMQRQIRAYQELVVVLWKQHGDQATLPALAIAEAARARSLLDALGAAGVAVPAVTTPLDARAIQALVPAGAILIMYVASERQLFAFAVTRDRATMTALPRAGTRREIAARIELYRDLLATVDDPEELLVPGRALYDDLLAPLVGDSRVVLIAADGPLHALPFEALVRPDGAFVVEHADIAMTPSGSLLAPRAPSLTPSPLLAVAAPPLRAAVAEAAAIDTTITERGTVLAGVDATEAKLRASDPGGFGVLHFATHAEIDDLVPSRSGLQLAPGTNSALDDGWLRADEIYRLQLHATVVVLSGCQTGAGHISVAEGPMSLARAFLHAGAHSVIATLWNVEDRHGPAMTRALYRELGAHEPIATALSRAKRTLIADRLPPRAWSPWVAIGPPSISAQLTAAPIENSGGHLALAALLLGSLGLAALVTAFVLGRRTVR